MIRRDIIFSVLLPQFDIAVAGFRARPTAARRDRLIAIVNAMECAKRRPISVLDKILRNVSPKEYVKAICTYR